MNRLPLRRSGRASGTPRAASRSRRRAAFPWLVSALLLLGSGSLACNTGRPPPRAEPAPEPEPGPLPPIHEPLTWDKLVKLEEWLDTEGTKRNPNLRIEVQLQLNEGRVAYSRNDLEKGTAPPKTVRTRLEAARDGFGEIEADPLAGTASKARAKIGKQSVLALLDAPVSEQPDLVVIRREQWKAMKSRTDRLTPLKGAWSRITVHHSDESRSDQTGGSLEDSQEVVRLIQKFHMEDPEHHWGDVGYHFLIDSAGRIFEGRELAWQGAHAGGPGGRNNAQNIGICMLGDFQKRSPTPAAFKSLELLIDSLCDQHRIPKGRVYSHKEFTVTQCPGPALSSWLEKRYR